MGLRVTTMLATVAALTLPSGFIVGSASSGVPIQRPEVSGLSFEYSKDYDLFNQAKAVEYFEAKFYLDHKTWVLEDKELEEALSLGRRALQEPVLALAAAQVLYMFAWFRRSGELIRENIAAAAQLFEHSIQAGGCDPALPTNEWVDRACDIRWAQSAMLYNWLGETDDDAHRGQSFLSRGDLLLHGLKNQSRYGTVGKMWTSPRHINFNSLRFPSAPSRPLWDSSKVPLAVFLEQNHRALKAELEALLEAPGDLFEQLRMLDGSKECLATPGGWETVRIVRYGEWYDLFCNLAPRTCELLASRPEISNCSYVNANYQKLLPNAHLKPHFGNAPRLAAHLPVLAPEPLRAAMTVGGEKTLWVEGRVIVFDDTFSHAVSHWGSAPRYVLNIWFCHPCDENNAHMQECPTS